MAPTVAESAQGKRTQPEDVAAPETAAVTAAADEVDLAALDEDDRVPPVGLLVRQLAVRRDRDEPCAEGRRRPPQEEEERARVRASMPLRVHGRYDPRAPLKSSPIA